MRPLVASSISQRVNFRSVIVRCFRWRPQQQHHQQQQHQLFQQKIPNHNCNKWKRIQIIAIIGAFVFGVISKSKFSSFSSFQDKTFSSIETPSIRNVDSSNTVTTEIMKKPSIIEEFLSKNNKSNEYQNVHYFRRIAIELAKYKPSDILSELNEYDPFGVRTILQQIQNAEFLNQNQTISLSQLQSIFPCPYSRDLMRSTETTQDRHRITLPELRNMTKLLKYQQQMLDITIATENNNHIQRKIDDTNYFIYFQHLRKAGGTHFCTMAQQNIPQPFVPKYYCMPDNDWIPESFTSQNRKKKDRKIFNPSTTKEQLLRQPPPQRTSDDFQPCEGGCLHRYSNDEIIRHMSLYKIASNEWDNFRVSNHLDLPAIFVTSFRQPIPRAISQYRFECADAMVKRCGSKNEQSNVDSRNNKNDNKNSDSTILQYWNRRRDLYNIYTSTFSDVNIEASASAATKRITGFAHQQQQQQQQRSNAMGIAYDTLTRFHLILIMELLPYSERLIQDVLGFHNTSLLRQRVTPINFQRSSNNIGLVPEHDLSSEEYSTISESLALDEVLYDVARRIFFERLVCTG